jgi:hypothetical protein
MVAVRREPRTALPVIVGRVVVVNDEPFTETVALVATKVAKPTFVPVTRIERLAPASAAKTV